MTQSALMLPRRLFQAAVEGVQRLDEGALLIERKADAGAPPLLCERYGRRGFA